MFILFKFSSGWRFDSLQLRNVKKTAGMSVGQLSRLISAEILNMFLIRRRDMTAPWSLKAVQKVAWFQILTDVYRRYLSPFLQSFLLSTYA